MPQTEGFFTAGDALSVVGMFLAAIFLLVGLRMALPEEWRGREPGPDPATEEGQPSSED